MVSVPMMAGRGHHHHQGHDGHGNDAVDDGAPVQGLDGVERRKAQGRADDGGRDDDAIEFLRGPRRQFQAVFPVEGARHGVGGRTGQHGMASKPVPMMPRLNRAKANSPAMGRRAEAAWAEVSICVMPCAPRVTAVVSMMKNATRLEKPMPMAVSILMRWNCRGACRARGARLARVRLQVFPPATLAKE
jgi:hypothetical protein